MARSEGREAAKVGYLDGVKRRGRVRRVAKWAGLVVTALLAVLWAASVVWDVSHSRHIGGAVERWAGIESGCAFVAHTDFIMFSGYTGQSVGWQAPFRDKPFYWIPHWEFWSDRSFQVFIPLWIPMLLLAAPTCCLWWRGRSPWLGHCKCGYDLAGLAPGAACPECGKTEQVKR